MNNDLAVGAVIALMVIASVSYMLLQRKRGMNSCGCKGCTRCRSQSAVNVTIDDDGDACKDKD